MKYKHIPYMSAETFPTVSYGKAGALRTPLCLAINTARTMPDDRMDEVIDILETALAHIRQGQAHEEVTTAVSSDDPLDSLLGPAETKPNSSKRRSKGRG